MRFPMAIAGVVALLVAPAVAPTYIVHIATFVAIYTLPVIGLGFLSGFTNRISLAQGAIFGIGAYVTGLLTTKYGWSPAAAFLPSVAGAVLVATVLGAPAMRLAGLYFVMATIAIHQIVWIVLMNWIELTNGPQGVRSIPPLSIGSLTLEAAPSYFYAAFACALVSFVLARRIVASRFGLKLRALSDDEFGGVDVGSAGPLGESRRLGAERGLGGCRWLPLRALHAIHPSGHVHARTVDPVPDHGDVRRL